MEDGIGDENQEVHALSLRPPPLVTSGNAANPLIMYTMISATTAWATITHPGSASSVSPKLGLPHWCGEAAPDIRGREKLREFERSNELAEISSHQELR